MKKVIIQVEEQLRYHEEIEVIQPDGMTDAEFDDLINKAERQNRSNSTTEDLAYSLEELGLEAKKVTDNFPRDPHDWDLEIVDVRDKKET